MSQCRYDVDWSDEHNPKIVIAQPGVNAMTYAEAQKAINEAQADRATNPQEN